MTAAILGNTVFDQTQMQRWGERATKDPLVLRSATMARLLVGLRNTDSKHEAAWLAVTQNGVTAGVGDIKTDFCFAGPADAFADLFKGVPFNRLIRQHRLDVQGDVRSCVQNWLLLYAVMRASVQQRN